MLVFFEKPGCITNGKQKKLLEKLGIEFTTQNILTTAWDVNTLGCFFSDAKHFTEVLNPNSPRVKSGELSEVSSVNQALQMMVKDPLLIKRPLMSVGSQCWAGFDLDVIAGHLHIEVPPEFSAHSKEAVEQCSRS